MNHSYWSYVHQLNAISLTAPHYIDPSMRREGSLFKLFGAPHAAEYGPCEVQIAVVTA